MTRYCCFWENTCMSGNLLSSPSISQKIIVQEVINTQGSWRTLRSLVWLTSPSTLIWSYLHRSEGWQAVAWGFVFCFRGRSQAWAWICARPNHHASVIYHHVSAWASAALFSVTQLIYSVNHGGVEVKCGFFLGANIHTKAAHADLWGHKPCRFLERITPCCPKLKRSVFILCLCCCPWVLTSGDHVMTSVAAAAGSSGYLPSMLMLLFERFWHFYAATLVVSIINVSIFNQFLHIQCC